MNKTIKLTEQQLSELLSNAWNAAADSDSYLLNENEKAIYINQQIDKYFPSSKPITAPVIEVGPDEIAM